jgi:hypothetical protein
LFYALLYSILLEFDQYLVICIFLVFNRHLNLKGIGTSLHCSDYLHCFGLDPVATAFSPASSDLKNVNILHPSMVCAASVFTDQSVFS